MQLELLQHIPSFTQVSGEVEILLTDKELSVCVLAWVVDDRPCSQCSPVQCGGHWQVFL